MKRNKVGKQRINYLWNQGTKIINGYKRTDSCIVIFHTELRRRTMNPICPLLFFFWFFNTLAYLFRFYSIIIGIHINKNVPEDILIGFKVLTGVTFSLFSSSLVFECFSRYSKDRIFLNNKMPCPEEFASIVSKMTYSWLDKYIYNWFKKEMTDETTFDLRHADESSFNTDLVENVFLEKLRQYKMNKNVFVETPGDSIIANSSTNLLENENENKSKSSKIINHDWILFCSLVKVYMPEMLIAWIIRLLYDIFIFSTPFLLKILMENVQNKNENYWMGYCLAVLFLFTGVFNSITMNMCLFISTYLSIRIRAALIGMVYRKTLKMNNEVRATFTSGEIVNLMSVDAGRIMNFIFLSWFFVAALVEISLAVVFLYQEMGYAIFSGLSFIIIFFPINGLIMKFTRKYSDIELTWKDKRVKLLTQILHGIRVLKMYAWENSFLSKVTQLRDIEMKYIFLVSGGWSLISVLWETLPFLTMLVTFLTYVFSDNRNIITPEKAFVCLTLFNLMRFPMTILPWGLTGSINAFVSLKRISSYLVGEELDENGINHHDDSSGPHAPNDIVIEIKEGSFSWKKDEKIILNKIDLEVQRGKLIAIVGKVGTGKSSLISALLGEMQRLNGSIRIQGKIAYVSQEAWIQNKSLKDNIIFTEVYNEKFYHDVLYACSLLPDLKQLPAGDSTEIGERGINLSGGQKQRVSLARAVYQNRDIYLLDDPLSAVDAHVGQHLFEHVISNNGLLKGKTRILVTHGLNWLPKVDEVFVMDSNGSISERGPFKELLKNGDDFMQFIQEHMDHKKNIGLENISFLKESSDAVQITNMSKQLSDHNEIIEEFPELIMNSPVSQSPVQFSRIESRKSVSPRMSNGYSTSPIKYIESSIDEHQIAEFSLKSNICKSQESTEKEKSDQPIKNDSISGKQLIDEEFAMSGNVKWITYYMYIAARGLKLFTLTSLIYIICTLLQIFSNFWLKEFTEDSQIINASSYILKNSSYIPEMSIIIKERTQFYMLRYTYIGLGLTFIICLYWLGFTFSTVRASKIIHKDLLHAILRSSMQFFDTTPSGRILNRFTKDMETIDHTLPMNISDFLNCLFIVFGSIGVIIYVTPWFAVVILPIGIIYFFIQLFYMPSSRQARRLDSIATSPLLHNFSETIQGIAVIRAFKVQNYFQILNENLVNRSTKFKFIQFGANRWLSLRIDTLGNLLVFAAVISILLDQKYITAGLVGLSISYSLQITDNLNWLLRQYTEMETNSVSMERIREYTMIPSEAKWNQADNISDNWPSQGTIKFHNYDLRYREGLPLVLKGINLYIKGGEKIGVVGRTGAGKSSLNLALFRLVEAAGGVILIDGVDISTLGLHDLRKKLTILPQDPVIFSGTIRDNLDPFSVHSEDELFQSLETAHLRQWVSSLSEGIDYECGEGGTNLSAGQKQLLCLARALLRKSKVLILDEATASVDVETDRLVMQTIREHFRASTVIIIAHRIDTILDTDKIVVMDNGEIVEMDTPSNLLAKSDSVFKSLHEQSTKHDL